jgi:3'(2'), 5'-bisphosphate nucleotidase
VRHGWQQYWLIDPLDGTKEFISRNGEFTVNVALMRDHRPVLGVVSAPVLDIVYYGAWQAAGPFSLAATAPASRYTCGDRRRRLWVVVGSRSHRGDSLDAVLERLGPHEMRPMGSSLKICLVAEGSADFYPRLGPRPSGTPQLPRPWSKPRAARSRHSTASRCATTSAIRS